MAGKAWTPKSDEQKTLLAETIAAFTRAEQQDEKAAQARAHAWELAAKANAAGVPKTHLAEATRQGTATVDRHLSPGAKANK